MSLKFKLQKIRHFISWPNHTPKRFINRVANFASKLVSAKRVIGMPSTVMIEISSACQLKCPLCPIGNDTLERGKKVMSLEKFKQIIDELGDYLYHININGMGEPLINNSVVEMIKYAKKKNIYVDLYTNFEITDKRGIIDGLVEAGLDSILIAVDGATKDVYESYRIKGNFERVKDNIKKLVAARNKAGASHPEINIQFVQMKQNQHQSEDMKKLSATLGADTLAIKRPFLFWGQKEQADQFLPDDEALNMYRIEGDKISWKGEEKKICELLWTSSVILPDGSVTPCCFDYEGHANFGNIEQSSFKEIWNGKKYKAFRKAMTRDWRKIPLCAKEFEGGCPNMFMQPEDWLISNKTEQKSQPADTPKDSVSTT